MPFTYTFSNGVVMTGWDTVVLTNQPPAYVFTRCEREFEGESKQQLVANEVLSVSERRAAYTARWGTPNACPPQGVGCREELLRYVRAFD